MSQTMERRQREEEVVNWSFVLKYLLSTNSKLRRQLQADQALNAKILSEAAAATMTTHSGVATGSAVSSIAGAINAAAASAMRMSVAVASPSASSTGNRNGDDLHKQCG